MKKGIALLLALAMCLAAVPALAAWEVSGGRYWYSYEDGSWAADRWIQDGAWYYMDGDGWMSTGWKQIGGSWYYFGSFGAMATGLRQIGGSWYYFGITGAMVTGWHEIEGRWYYFGTSGAMTTGWRQIGGSWYYFEDSGAMKTGWLQQGDNWYYLTSAGTMAIGWQMVGNNWYFMNQNGVMETGWKQVGGKWYYLDENGAMKTGWLEDGGACYYLGTDGQMVTGWKRIDRARYYFEPSGAMKTGWLQVGSDWYYLNEGGTMVTGTAVIEGVEYTFDASGVWQPAGKNGQAEAGGGWAEADGGWMFILDDGSRTVGWKEIKSTWYFFNENGLMQTGWLQQGEKRYYLADNGAMVTGRLGIDGIMYTFDASGVMTGSSGIDFGGKTIYIYDWWTGLNWDEVDYENLTEEEKALYDYRKGLEEKYNCKIVTKAGTEWGSCVQDMTEFCANGGSEDGSYVLFIVEPGSVSTVIQNGLAAPINYDTSAEKWNQADISLWSIGGQKYGLNTGASEPRQCLYFNKRILEEANIDWNTIYDAQKNGTWTWTMFEDMMKQVTKDADGDGVYDVYGLIGSRDDMEVSAVFTNGGSFFDLDSEGQLYPSMGNDTVEEALTWAIDIWSKYSAPNPEGSNWDWYKEDWKQGYCAFYVGQTWQGFNDNSEMSDMEDEWGYVAFPISQEGGNYITVTSDNVTLIPSCYNADTVSQLAFIYDMWTNPTPGYEEDDWIGNKYNYTDERAVDETYAMLREPKHAAINRTLLLGTQNDILGSSLLWPLSDDNPAAALIKAGMAIWQELCDIFNAAIEQIQ